jgi:hypothetical protein
LVNSNAVTRAANILGVMQREHGDRNEYARNGSA